VRTKRTNVIARLASGIDLLIDFATLGEYGLEPTGDFDAGCEGRGETTGWEALATERRGGACRRSNGSTATLSAV
jgi:hypothetical protein